MRLPASRTRMSLPLLAAVPAGLLAAVPGALLAGILGAALAFAPPALAASRAGGPVWEADAYEGDDTTATARDVTHPTHAYGVLYEEEHTFDAAGPSAGDQDWFRFSVSHAEAGVAVYLIEAHSADPAVDPVIEVYGPSGSALVPSDPLDLATPTEQPGANGCVAADDQSPWMYRGAACAFSARSLPAGTYYVRIRPHAGPGGYGDGAGPYTFRFARGLFSRLYGDDRVGTAVAISREQFPTYPVASREASVVVTRANDYPDALAGSVLCGASGGPLLLTWRDSLPSTVAEEIERLGVRGVYVLGGTGVVTDRVVDAIRAISPALRVVRVAGPTRVETAANAALEAERVVEGRGERMPKLAVVASGWRFPDALCASPIASGDRVPVLLTHYGYLDARAASTIDALGVTDVVIVGGTGVVSSAVEGTLRARLGGREHVLRLGGVDRYETSKNVAAWAAGVRGPGAHGDGYIGTIARPQAVRAFDGTTVGVATGLNFPDALAGGTACGRAGGVLLLSHRNDLSPRVFGPVASPATTYWHDIGYRPLGRGYVFGGTDVLYDSALAPLCDRSGVQGP